MRVLIVLLALIFPLSLSAAEKLKVVTSFSILADITRQIGGDTIVVQNLVAPGQDAHTYTPTTADTQRLLKADLIVENGLGYEPWLDSFIAKNNKVKPTVVASTGVIPVTTEQKGNTVTDPYAWLNLANVELYIDNITTALIAADPNNAKIYTSNSKNYVKQIHALLVQARLRFGALSEAERNIVTSYNELAYMGHPYGIYFIAPAGISTGHELSSAELAALIKQIKNDKINAVFMDNIKDPHSLQQITDKTSARVGGPLYTTSLATQGPAATFLGMYEYNLDTLYDALKKQ